MNKNIIKYVSDLPALSIIMSTFLSMFRVSSGTVCVHQRRAYLQAVVFNLFAHTPKRQIRNTHSNSWHSLSLSLHVNIIGAFRAGRVFSSTHLIAKTSLSTSTVSPSGSEVQCLYCIQGMASNTLLLKYWIYKLAFAVVREYRVA